MLLDIEGPNVDGPSLARELRICLRQIPLMVVTSVSRPDRAANARNAIACQPKPSTARAHVRVVRRFAR